MSPSEWVRSRLEAIKPSITSRFSPSRLDFKFLETVRSAIFPATTPETSSSERESGEGGPESYDSHAARSTRFPRKELQFEESSFHIAVVGNKESGKSTLIDTLRGISAGSKDSALRTMNQDNPSHWLDQNISNYSRGRFIWYEYSSRDNEGFPGSHYFKPQNLNQFDAVLVLVDVRLTEYDVGMLQICALNRIPYLIVRSKADQHIRNMYQSMRSGEDDDDDDEVEVEPKEDTQKIFELARNNFIQTTRQNFEEVLAKAGFAATEPPNKVFLVSSSVIRNVVKGKTRLQGDIDEKELIERLKILSNTKTGAASANAART